MKRILSFICVIALLSATGCIVADGHHHGRGHRHHHPKVIVPVPPPPVIIVPAEPVE